MRSRVSAFGAMLFVSLALPCAAQALASARVGATAGSVQAPAVASDAELQRDGLTPPHRSLQGVARGRCPAAKVALAMVAGGFVGAGAGHAIVELFSFGGLLTQHDTQQRQLRIARLMGAIGGAAGITAVAVHNGADC